jgi:hypothetical protein
VGLGVDPLLDDFWSYDPSNDHWTAMASFPGGAREATFSFAINGFGYVGTGTSDQTGYTGLNDFWYYKPSTNSWQQLGNFPGGKRHSSVSFVVTDKAYVGTGIDGYSGGTFYTNFYEFDGPSGTWSLVDSFPGGGRGSSTAFAVGNCGYVFGGAYFPVGSPTFYNDLWSYCLTTGIHETDARKINIVFNSVAQTIAVDCGNYPMNNGTISIYDLQGKSVYSSSINSNQFQIPFTNQAVGIYSYQITENGKIIKSGRIGM